MPPWCWAADRGVNSGAAALRRAAGAAAEEEEEPDSDADEGGSGVSSCAMGGSEMGEAEMGFV